MQLSESLTISIILTLIFGAVFYYLYSRLGQSEKRVSLLENILLDLKVAMESNLIRREDLDNEEFVRSPPTFQNFMQNTNDAVEPDVNLDADTEVADVVDATEAAVEQVKPSQVPTGDQFDRMTNKELKEAAKAKKVKGYSTLNRVELQTVLREVKDDVNGLDLTEGTMTLDA